MSTLKTHNLQSPDAGSVNIAMTPNAGMIVAGIMTASSGYFINSSNNYVVIGSSNAGGASLVLDGDSNGDGAGGDYSYIQHDSSGDLNIIANNPAVNANIVFYTGATEKVRITSTGRMGINETSPDSLLHVRNDNSYAAKIGGQGGGSEYYMEIGQLGSNSSAGFNATGAQGAMLFRLNGSEKMRIDKSGDIRLPQNVGIQTNDVTRTNLVGAGSSLVGMYIGDGSILFNKTLNRTGGYYISTEVNALNAGPVTLDSTMTLDGTWVIV